jgi:hypothetical protein
VAQGAKGGKAVGGQQRGFATGADGSKGYYGPHVQTFQGANGKSATNVGRNNRR